MSLPEEIREWSDIKSFIPNWYISREKKSATNPCRMTAGITALCAISRKCCKMLIWNECCRESSFLKWTEPGASKFVKCMLIYYILLMQLLVNARKQQKVEALWKSPLKSKGAVVGIVGRHLHLFLTSQNWDSDSAHTKMFFTVSYHF